MTTMPPCWALRANSGGRLSFELAMAIATAEALVVPYRDVIALLSCSAARGGGRRDKLPFALPGSVTTCSFILPRLLGRQGCRGQWRGNQEAQARQAPRVAVSGAHQLIGLHRQRRAQPGLGGAG